MHALVLDPQRTRRDALERELRRQGYDVTTVRSVDEASRRAAELDAEVVAVGGADALSAAARLADEDRLVVIVAAPSEITVADALAAGAAAVWHLPADAAGALETRIALAQHLARLQAEHLRVGGEFALLRQALDLTGTGFVLTDPRLEDNPIVYANESFLELTGYAADEVLGRNCRFLQGPETSPAGIEEMRRRLSAWQPVTVELVNYRKDGSTFVNEVHISPVRNQRGEVVRFAGVQVDVSAHREQARLFVHERGARAAAEAAERRSSFLAKASLDASLDLRSTLDSLTRLSVPFLADVCLVGTVRGDEVTRLAVAASDPGVERIARSLPDPYPVRPGDPVARAVESGRSEVLGAGPSIFGPAGDASEKLRADFPRASMIAPLKARGRILGVLAFASLSPERRYGPEELALAEELAQRAALALDNARLYENLGAVARALQEALLPERLPSVAGVELAARFQPAGDGSVIGGDFYDVLPHPDGFDLVIGDVTGKGARAAALTGLVRHTLRTAARYEGAPSEVLGVVNEALVNERGRTGRYCTVAMARVRVNADATATLCCAGHPMPMLVHADGSVEPVGRPGNVLGWVSDPVLRDVSFDLHGGESLVLYTDGVTEARQGIGAPMSGPRLEELLRSAAAQDASGIAGRVERAAARAGAQRDDVAVLVTRVRPAGSA